MDIAIAGGHGTVAMLLHPLLVDRGHTVRGLIRNPDQATDLEDVGAEAVLFDLESDDDITEVIAGADAVVFAAGAGSGSSAQRKWSVDRDGALKLIDGATRCGIDRYVMLSAMGVDADPDTDNEVFRAYLQAKAQADEALRNSGLAYTIIRPGSLTDDEPTGRIALGRDVDGGQIPRADVAAVIAYAVEHRETADAQLEVVSGNTPIDDAFRSACGSRRSSISGRR